MSETTINRYVLGELTPEARKALMGRVRANYSNVEDTVRGIIDDYVHDFRPALMRGSNELGGSATPGAMPASVMKVRPFSGSWTTWSCSMTLPRLPVSSRRMGASA